MKTQFATKNLVLSALFAALTAVCSQLTIPLAPVPINLAMLSVFVAGGLLGSTAGALSQLVYVLLGAIGIPVFASFTGGIGIVFGPTGGYIIGYIGAAWLIGFIIYKFGNQFYKLVMAMGAGLALCYLLGTMWFIFVTKTNWIEALMMCVVPFLVGDALKILVASIMISKLRKHIV